MEIALSDVGVEGRRGPLLEEMSLTVSTGECVLIAGEPGHGHTALALVATGRFRPFTGSVTLSGLAGHPGLGEEVTSTQDPAALRRVTALVDTPSITEPDGALRVADVVAEGLALSGHRSLPADVSRWLAEHSLIVDRRRRIDAMPGVLRTAMLASLATEGEAVQFLMLTLPDRHGGEPDDWWQVAQTIAAAGLGVLVQCTRASARGLGAQLPPARVMNEPPSVVLRLRPGAAPTEGTIDDPADQADDPADQADDAAPKEQS